LNPEDVLAGGSPRRIDAARLTDDENRLRWQEAVD
jgi:hypothetical protein